VIIDDLDMKFLRAYTILEVVISIFIFSVGLVLIGMSMGENLKLASNNYTHTAVRLLSSQLKEPLISAFSQGPQQLQNVLIGFNGANLQLAQKNQLAKRYSVSIAKSVDATGADLRTANVNSWVGPLSIVFEIASIESATPKKFYVTQVLTP